MSTLSTPRLSSYPTSPEDPDDSGPDLPFAQTEPSMLAAAPRATLTPNLDLDAEPLRISPHEPTYPRALRVLESPPVLTLSGPIDFSVKRKVVAIVGSREASDQASDFAYQLAYFLARANVVVVSGGAVGVDGHAHRGALAGEGTTWLVACTGRGVVYPESHEELFERVTTSGSSRIIWSFEDEQRYDKALPRMRNEVLVGLADTVVVIQAAQRSGSRNAARLARDFGRRLFIVPSTPWDPTFHGSLEHLGSGHGTPLCSINHLFEELKLPAPDLTDVRAARNGKLPTKLRFRRRAQGILTFHEPPHLTVDQRDWSEEEIRIFSMLSEGPAHRDEIIGKTGLGVSSTLTALLTLSLKDVVVEGPDGFFRRRTSS